jgi:hypothetical protein
MNQKSENPSSTVGFDVYPNLKDIIKENRIKHNKLIITALKSVSLPVCEEYRDEIGKSKISMSMPCYKDLREKVKSNGGDLVGVIDPDHFYVQKEKDWLNKPIDVKYFEVFLYEVKKVSS